MFNSFHNKMLDTHSIVCVCNMKITTNVVDVSNNSRLLLLSHHKLSLS
jgi:hypothetical protein